ncbi:MAG: hypothetical protein RUMPE_00002 [Eubacteriales bacterium SKADARSKE-1]|nr:hypothetical protein [Eubacteriales bacterium SKADARSKE-1]
MLKKCISLVLSLIMLSGIGSMGASALSLPWSEKEKVDIDICDQRNEAGGYFDLDCAESAGIRDIRKFSDKLKKIENVGPNAEYTLHFWPYETLVKFATQFKKDLFNADKSREYGASREKAVQEIMYSFGLRRATAEEVANRLISQLNLSKAKSDSIANGVRDDAISVKKWSFVGAIALALGGGALSVFCPPVAAVAASAAVKAGIVAGGAAVGGSIGGIFSASARSSEHAKDALSSEIDVDNYVSAIEQVLDYIKKDSWKDKDIIYIEFSSNPKKYYANACFRKINVLNEKGYEYYSKQIEELKSKLPEILNQYR